jgi:type VI secretion system protein ImpC
MRALLHHPDFQAVEAAWRSAALLVRRLPTDEHLQIYLLDVSKSELSADLLASADASRSQTNRLLVEETVGTPGAPPWAVVAGLYTFDPSRADVDLLGRIAAVAQAAGAPFLAAADIRFLGCDSLLQSPDPRDWRRPPDPDGGPAWEELRRRSEASFLGLALPRVLLRAPYGKETDATESFAFEEAPEGAGHEAYLWGNPAVVCAYFLADGFTRSGWDLHPGAGLEIEGLPLYVYPEGDERRQLPCAEVWLTVRAGDAILDRGIMPFLSIHGRVAVRLARFQSVASPVRPLAGRWGG